MRILKDFKVPNFKFPKIKMKNIENIEEVQAIIVSDSLISAAEKAVMGNDRHYRIGIKDEIYTVHTYIENGDTIFATNKTYGNANDVGTVNTNAKNMVIVKVNGDLTINDGVTLTSYGTNYGGPKGMLLYVTGNLENKGTITMTARGAKAEGQNVYLWKNNDLTQAEEYEFVPKVGASGGVAVTVSSWRTYKNGTTGTAGTARRTGGGGAGGVSRDDNPDTSYYQEEEEMEHLILEDQEEEQQGILQVNKVMTMEEREEMLEEQIIFLQDQEQEQETQEELIVQVKLQLVQEQMEQEDY